MTQPIKPARGRRNPALLEDVPEENISLESEHDGPEDGPQHEGQPLLFDGDLVTANITLAVDFGDGRTNFIGYKATTRVQEGELDSDVYARLSTVVNQGVFTAVEDTEASVEEYYLRREARLQKALQQR